VEKCPLELPLRLGTQTNLSTFEHRSNALRFRVKALLIAAILLAFAYSDSRDEESALWLFPPEGASLPRADSLRVVVIRHLPFGTMDAITCKAAGWAPLQACVEVDHTLNLPYLSPGIALQNITSTENDNGCSERRKLPPPRWVEKTLGGLAGGVLGGGIGAGAGFATGYLIDPHSSASDVDWAAGWGLVIGGLTGYLLGSAIGVYCVGDTPEEAGSFLGTLGGGLLGAPACLFPGVPIGATVGFNLTREYRSTTVIEGAPAGEAKTRAPERAAPLSRLQAVPGRPPLGVGRIAGETLAGAGGGLLLASLGAVLLGLYPAEEVLGYDRPYYIGTGAIVGWTLGSAIGVYSAGDNRTETASFLGTVGSSALATLICIGTGNHKQPTALALCPLAATIGFNLTRRYKAAPPPSGTGLLDLQNGCLYTALTSQKARSDPPETSVIVHSVRLLSIAF
jgi:hypothetical protein